MSGQQSVRIGSHRDIQNWRDCQNYEDQEEVSFNDNVYIALEDHTSSGSFATDLGAGKWNLVGGTPPVADTLQTVSTAGSTATVATPIIMISDLIGTDFSKLSLDGFGFGVGGTELSFDDTLGGGLGVQAIRMEGSFGNFSGIRVTDSATSKGLIYAADYSGAFTARSLVDKDYVDGLISVPTLAQVTAQGNNFGSSNVNITNAGSIIFDGDTQTIIEPSGGGIGISTKTGGHFTVTAGLNADLRLNLPTVTTGQIEIGKNAGAYGIQISTASLTLSDNINSKGFVYAADYSVNYTDRSIVDKGYVDGLAISTFTNDSNYVSGTGTLNKVAKFTGAGSIGDSSITDDGTTVTLSGNLTVQGTTTTVNSTTVQIEDPIFTLGGTVPPVLDDGKDKGIEFRWYDVSAKTGFFGYDRSSGRFTFIPDGTNTAETFTGTKGDVEFSKGYLTELQISTGATVDYVLRSDASGNATWVDPSTLAAHTLTNVLAAGSTMADGQTITSLNGGGYLSLGSANNTITLGNANGTFAKGWFYANDTDMQTGFGLGRYYEASATDLRLVSPTAVSNYVDLDYFEMTVGQRVALNVNNCPFRLFNTTNAVTLVASSTNRGLVLNNSGAVSFSAGVDHSVAISVTGGTVKTANTVYVSQLGFIETGDSFELIIDRTTVTDTDKKQTFQNATGDIALVGDWDSGQTFVVSNDITLRTIDADNIVGNSLRDLVCTLIRDLNTAGVLTV